MDRQKDLLSRVLLPSKKKAFFMDSVFLGGFCHVIHRFTGKTRLNNENQRREINCFLSQEDQKHLMLNRIIKPER